MWETLFGNLAVGPDLVPREKLAFVSGFPISGGLDGGFQDALIATFL